MATTINLAPGTQHIVALRARRQKLFIAAAILALATFLIWGGLYIYERQLKSREQQLTERIQNVNAEIANLDTDAQRIILFERRLQDLGGLLDAHISWNPVLADLERLLPSTTSLINLRADVESNSIVFNGVTPDIDQVAVTLASLTNTPSHKTVFTDARVTSINRSETKNADGTVASVEYQFDAEISFDPSILYINK